MQWIAGAWNSLPDWGKVVLLVLVFLVLMFALYLGLDMHWLPDFLTGQ